jgi:hypothetical protein
MALPSRFRSLRVERPGAARPAAKSVLMLKPPARLSHVIAAGALLSAMAAPALADPNSALMNAVIATSRQPSYHITLTGPSIGTAEGDVVNPGKMHMTMKMGETIVIRPDMYMKMDGKWKKFAGAGNTPDQSDAIKQMQLHHADYTSRDLGMRTVGGISYHAYLVTNLKKKTTETVFVDGGGRIGRFEMGDTVMTFTKYGENVSIVPPM